MATTKEQRPRLKALYFDKLVNELKTELELKNVNEVPRIEKIVINVGLGRAKDDKKLIEVATNTVTKVTGQRPVDTLAKKSIAGFKLREGNKIGLKTTLRGDRMYEFYDRLVNIVMPRLRDFHGVSNKSFDTSGNYSIGLADQSIFPELTFDETTNSHGLQINIIVKNKSKEHSKALLEKLGMPFMKENN